MKYAIEGQELTNIADALRRRHGETKKIMVTDYEIVPATMISKTPNATGPDSWEGLAPYGFTYDVITIPNATSIQVTLYTHTYMAYQHIYVVAGEYGEMSFPTNAKDYSTSNKIVQNNLVFENTDTITIKYHGVANENDYRQDVLGYYAEVCGLDANGNELGEQIIPIEVEQEVPNTYTSDEMAQAIDDIEVGAYIPEEVFYLTENCAYKFCYTGWTWFIDEFGDRITTKDLTNVEYMFQNNMTIKEIPFDLNLKYTTGGFEYMFYNCNSLVKFPKIINHRNISGHLKFGNMFNSCTQMREIPDGVEELLKQDYELSSNNSVFAQWSAMFSACYSLRKISSNIMKYMYNPTQTSYYYGLAYSRPFMNCFVLDELVGIMPDIAEYTSNQFTNWGAGMYRIKDFTFAVQEDGTPFIRKWKSQTIDLNHNSNCVGMTFTDSVVLHHNSGITADKEVTDDATYQALKNDPDWWTRKVEYSRYNHDSAVNTINSLPDTSAYGTNTIKFKGDSGSLTDGGAINTLTAEEIAVATAKGWTVTLA